MTAARAVALHEFLPQNQQYQAYESDPICHWRAPLGAGRGRRLARRRLESGRSKPSRPRPRPPPGFPRLQGYVIDSVHNVPLVKASRRDRRHDAGGGGRRNGQIPHRQHSGRAGIASS